MTKMTFSGFLEHTEARKIIVPTRIHAVIRISCPQPFNIARPGEHVYWISYDILHGFLPFSVHACKCAVIFLALYIV